MGISIIGKKKLHWLNNSRPCRVMQGESEEDMNKKKIDQLYKLLERAEREKDAESAVALRWAIFTLEQAAG